MLREREKWIQMEKGFKRNYAIEMRKLCPYIKLNESENCLKNQWWNCIWKRKIRERERGLSVMKVKWFELNVMKGIHKKDERLLKLSRNFTEPRGCVWKTFNVVLNAKQWIK